MTSPEVTQLVPEPPEQLPEAATTPEESANRERQSHRGRAVVGALVVGATVAGGVVAYKNWSTIEAIGGAIGAAQEVATIEIPDDRGIPGYEAPERIASPEQDTIPAMNILLIGSDTEGVDEAIFSGDVTGKRSDAILLMSLREVTPDTPEEDRGIELLSIPRDSQVVIPGRAGEDKINHAFSYGGVPLTQATVEQLIQDPIDGVVAIDFSGLIASVEKLGGVTLTNNIAFSSRGYEFAAGEVTITDGKQALAFLRARYNFTDGDIQRTRNHQAFMEAVFTKVARGGAEGVLNMFPELAPHMTVSSNLADPLTLIGLIRSRYPDAQNIQTATFPHDPARPYGQLPNGLSTVNLDRTGITDIQIALDKGTLHEWIAAQD